MVGFVVSGHDITALKHAERALAQSREHETRMRHSLEAERDVRELFVSTLTHDMRTPMAAEGH